MANSSPTPNPVIEVAAGVVFRQGQLLIAQRSAEAHLGGLWEFPGGKREPHESLEDCLHRELDEELAIRVAILGRVEHLTHHYPAKTVILHFFHCRWIGQEPQAIGCADFRWVRSEQLCELTFPPADERLLKTLRSSPNLWLV